MGSGLTYNTDRAEQSLLAPDGEAQESAGKMALSVAGIDQVALLHVHGIGQKVADTSEIYAMRRVYCPVVLINHKGNFGHGVAASGLLAIMVTTLALHYRVAPCHVGLTTPIKALGSAGDEMVAPVDHVHALDKDGVLVGAVNGHAISGVNVHIIVQDPGAPRSAMRCDITWNRDAMFQHTLPHRATSNTVMAKERSKLEVTSPLPLPVPYP